MTSYISSRQNALTGAPLEEIEQRLAALVAAFGIGWLEQNGSNPLQQLWNRTDAHATNQLVWFGDAILCMQAADRKWTDSELRKVKAELANNRSGAAFEILGLGMYAGDHRVVPSPGGNPGYDGTIHFPGDGKLALSLKNYGMSVHERSVQAHGAELETAFSGALKSLALNGIDLRVIAKKYPSESDWARLVNGLPEIIRTDPRIPGHCFQDDTWCVFVRPLAGYESRTDPYQSYQVTVLVPLHANENQNLISKLDQAYANAAKHAQADPDLCRGIVIRLPENASMEGCRAWARDYFRDRPEGPVDLVIFYQPAIADTGNDSTAITHAFGFVEGPRYHAWANPTTGAARRLVGRLFVGLISSEPTKLILRNDDGTSLSTDPFYVFQRGHLHVGFDQKPGGGFDMTVGILAPGIVKHAILFDSGYQAGELHGIFPPTYELLVFT